ncbi:uncharacterized protein Z520_03514 [Fonsecaea multimorphosa CBS 102226]|uniref:Uncharacterized protein n=1 Tax=Fonsecaea multimorphosa CBS 102226 TaxID=1442371 RepID=A0A0D2K4W9_9EURO|nr:uncharacterized protein Z520_03514 [Fonsecaea multimorphosa CBS 102226]KIY00848.1 hypothetical protein Z520_03514 [Fonsecaea multimorphosa CBS 102226]OAL27677.1 hypothetical protein AYO22_03343 [Fonsecaea multimorphosa]
MHGWGLFFFLLFLLLIFAIVGWVVYTQYSARKQGLPAPSLKSWKTYIPFLKPQASSNYPAPRHAGPLEWARDQFAKLTRRRTARGAYEEAGSGADGLVSGSGGRGRGGRGMEDDAWDTRVGNEDPYGPGAGGYSGYEEQELGLAPTPGLQNEPYGGGASRGAGGAGGGDYLGATGSAGYSDIDVSGGGRGRPGSSSRDNPFGDQHEAPRLRSVSPRPDAEVISTKGHTKGNQSLDTQGSGSGDGNSSPISTRKSVFREGI